MRSRRRPIGALAVVLSAMLVLAPITTAHAETDYPTWDEVQKAKNNEAAKREQIARIESIIAGLEGDAASYSRVALERAEEYNQAIVARDEASTRAEKLQRQADAALATSQQSRVRAGQLIAYVARSGSGDLTTGLILGLVDPDDLLTTLGSVSKLSEQTALIYERALREKNNAESLGAQAVIAREEQSKLAATAKASLEAAEKAAAEAKKRTARQDGVAEELYAQLASLKGTTSAIEQAYLDGVAWEKAQNEIKDPPAPPPPVNPTPDPPSQNAVTGAIAFARAQLGDRYLLNGEGPDAWDCSGLTLKSYASVGVSIGTHSATNQYATMQKAKRLVPYDEIVAGDLLFYSSGGAATATKYHVTLYIGGGQMIEAPYPGAPVRIKAVRFGDLVPYAGRPTP